MNHTTKPIESEGTEYVTPRATRLSDVSGGTGTPGNCGPGSSANPGCGAGSYALGKGHVCANTGSGAACSTGLKFSNP
jgi:hypothetical protein